MFEESYKYREKTIENIKDVLWCISDNMSSSPIIGVGYKGLIVQGHEALTSAINSLEVIDFCISKNYFSDAYSSLRKIRDDLLQQLFIYINLKNKLLEKYKCDIDEILLTHMDREKFRELSPDEKQRVATYAAELWSYNDLTDSKNVSLKKLFFDYTKYVNYIINSSKEINVLYKQYFEKSSESLNRKLNNYVHSNGYRFLHNNFGVVDKVSLKEEFFKDLCYILKVYISFLAITDSFALRSSDYLDALEMDEIPIPGSVSWIAPSIKAFMTENLDETILYYIQEHQNGEMSFIDNNK